ncbi:MAG: hypothetical protein H6625_11395 [Bdellovibrionaceae bacterium]|nr:hypothetical protein [Pseudobdellovibrionaceae bacterium]
MKLFILLVLFCSASISTANEIRETHASYSDGNTVSTLVATMETGAKIGVSFENNRFSRKLHYGSRVLLTPSNPILMKESINGGSYKTGTVVEVFKNGKVNLLIDSRNKDYFSKYNSIEDAMDLTESVPRLGEVRIGDRVINEFNQTGRIVEIFKNGLVNVLFDKVSVYTTYHSGVTYPNLYGVFPIAKLTLNIKHKTGLCEYVLSLFGIK